MKEVLRLNNSCTYKRIYISRRLLIFIYQIILRRPDGRGLFQTVFNLISFREEHFIKI